MAKKKSHYETLGVKKTATHEEVKRAYRRKARTAHPDVGGKPEEMAELNRAWECLGDPQRRLTYDETGTDDRKPSIIEAVRSILLGVFSALIQNPNVTSNYIASAKTLLKAKRDEIDINRQKAKSDQKSLTKKRGKVKRKAGENVFQMVIDQKLREIDVALTALEDQMAAFDAALKELDSYEGDAEAKMAMKFIGMPTATAGWVKFEFS